MALEQKTKKIVAREGLLILAIIFFSVGSILIGENLGEYKGGLSGFEILKLELEGRPSSGIWVIRKFGQLINQTGYFFLFLGYPLTVIVRFVIWAVIILKEKV